MGSASGGVRETILGVPIDPLGRRETLELITEIANQGSPGLVHLVTLNPEYVVAARRDHHFLAAIGQAEVIVCDGMGTLLAAKAILGTRARPIERLAGVEIVEHLATAAESNERIRVYLLGGKDADAAAAGLTALAPGSRAAGGWSGGSAEPEFDDESLSRIAESRATVVLVAYGAPDQVLWIERNRHRLEVAGVRLAIGVGGSLDYLSGHVSRAPLFLRKLGLEWLYRLGREPWRWRRQLALPLFAALTAGETFQRRVLRR